MHWQTCIVAVILHVGRVAEVGWYIFVRVRAELLLLAEITACLTFFNATIADVKWREGAFSDLTIVLGDGLEIAFLITMSQGDIHRAFVLIHAMSLILKSAHSICR